MNTEKQISEKLRQQLLKSRFFQDMEVPFNINGHDSNRATWNLICSIRDVKLFNKGLIITRSWRLKHVKDYFNIKGNSHKIQNQLEQIKDFFVQ